MSGLTQPQVQDATPPEVQQLRTNFAAYLQNPRPTTTAGTATQPGNGWTGGTTPQSPITPPTTVSPPVTGSSPSPPSFDAWTPTPKTKAPSTLGQISPTTTSPTSFFSSMMGQYSPTRNVSTSTQSTVPPTSVPIPPTAQAPTSQYYQIDSGPTAAIRVAQGAQFMPYEQPLTAGARQILEGMYPGSTLEYIPGRGIVVVPQGTAPMAPQIGGGFPGNVDMTAVSPNVIHGELPQTPVVPTPGAPVVPGYPGTYPENRPPTKPDWMPQDMWDSIFGGGQGGGNGAGSGSAPSVDPSTFSAFDRMVAQLPPDMQRVVLGNPALVEQLRQATESFDAPQTQSIDQLGGVNSAFFNNMMQQLAPAFDQRRAEALAAAKEASGNLTGSGYANTLGSAINRSLGEERATLADYASRGVQSEIARQLQQAGLDMGALELGQRGQFFNIGNDLQRQGLNAQAINDFMKTQAGMDFQRLLTQYGAGVDINQQNANRYLQGVLGTIGAPTNSIASGGIGSFLGPLLQALPFILAA